MSADVLEKYTSRVGVRPEPRATRAAEPRAESREEAHAERGEDVRHALVADEVEDQGCFGWLRGVRERAIMLELRKRDGHVLAVGYAWLESVEFVPEEGLTLYLPGRKVIIKGSGLNTETRSGVRLFDGLLRHRVPWMRESDRAASIANPQGVAIESIRWEA